MWTVSSPLQESVKPVFIKAKEDGSCERQAGVCRQTLYTCLEVGLRLLSPLMPFVTEELYQRLPRRKPHSDPPSICVTPYPDTQEVRRAAGRTGDPDPHQCSKARQSRSFHSLQFCWQCGEVDRDMDFIMAVVKTIRSLRSDYKLTKTAADCKSKENYLWFAAKDDVNLLDCVRHEIIEDRCRRAASPLNVPCNPTRFPSGYLQCVDSATVALVQKYRMQIQTLSYSQAVIPLLATQPAPEGCAVAIASDRCTVNLMLKVRRDQGFFLFIYLFIF